MIPVILLLALFVILFMAFINFDRLVQTEYKLYRDSWIQDGKPRGFFWKPPKSSLISGWFAMQRLTFSWLFKTPNWVQSDIKATSLLRNLRKYVLIWNIGIIMWAMISMLIAGT